MLVLIKGFLGEMDTVVVSLCCLSLHDDVSKQFPHPLRSVGGYNTDSEI